MADTPMRTFWDDRAEEDAYYFVDNKLRYGDPDTERFWKGGHEVVDRMLATFEVEVQPGDVVVDIGCGIGRITRPLAERAGTVQAIDVSQRMLDLAQEVQPDLKNVTWLLGDGKTLTGIPDDSADLCFSFVVFQHLPDPELTLNYVREIGRALKPGGCGIYQVSNDPTIHRPRSASERIRTRLRALLGRGPGGQTHPAWLGSAVLLPALRAAAEGAGTAVERTVGEGTQMCWVLQRKPG